MAGGGGGDEDEGSFFASGAPGGEEFEGEADFADADGVKVDPTGRLVFGVEIVEGETFAEAAAGAAPAQHFRPPEGGEKEANRKEKGLVGEEEQADRHGGSLGGCFVEGRGYFPVFSRSRTLK